MSSMLEYITTSEGMGRWFKSGWDHANEKAQT